MYMNLQNSKYSIFVLCLLLISSCKTDFSDVEVPNWEPSFAVPLVNTTINIERLLDTFSTGGFLDIDEDKFLTLVYEGEVLSLEASNLFQIPDDFSLPFFDTLMTISYDAFTDAQPQTIHLSNGQLTFDVKSETNEPLNLLFRMPNFTLNGQPLEVTGTVAAMGTQSISIDITDYTFEMSNNEYTVYYSATRTNGTKVFLEECQVTFNDLDYNYVDGYLGQVAFDIPIDSIILDIFANPAISSQTVFLEEPSIKFDIQNTFGVPVFVGIQSVKATRDNNSVLLTGSFVDNGIVLQYPTLNQVGEAQTTHIEISQNTSNIASFISLLPKEITYDLEAGLNPDGNPNTIGHITDSSFFKVDVDVELPIYGRASGFTFEEEFEFDATLYQGIKSASFKLVTENGFPLDVDIQVYFLDGNGTLLDSLLTSPNQQLLQAAPVDNNGRVTEANSSTIEEVFTKDRFTQLDINARKILVRANLATLNNGTESVRIYSDYTIGIRLGMIAELEE